jgi:hypothetical protein
MLVYAPIFEELVFITGTGRISTPQDEVLFKNYASTDGCTLAEPINKAVNNK